MIIIYIMQQNPCEKSALEFLETTYKHKMRSHSFSQYGSMKCIREIDHIRLEYKGNTVKIYDVAYTNTAEVSVLDYNKYEWVRELLECLVLKNRIHFVGMKVEEVAKLTDPYTDWSRVFNPEVILNERLPDLPRLGIRKKFREFLYRRITRILNEYMSALKGNTNNIFKVRRIRDSLYLGYGIDPTSMNEDDVVWKTSVQMVREAGLYLLASYADIDKILQDYREAKFKD